MSSVFKGSSQIRQSSPFKYLVLHIPQTSHARSVNQFTCFEKLKFLGSSSDHKTVAGFLILLMI